MIGQDARRCIHTTGRENRIAGLPCRSARAARRTPAATLGLCRVKRRVKTGNLRKLRVQRRQRGDGGEVVRLVQRGQRIERPKLLARTVGVISPAPRIRVPPWATRWPAAASSIPPQCVPRSSRAARTGRRGAWRPHRSPLGHRLAGRHRHAMSRAAWPIPSISPAIERALSSVAIGRIERELDARRAGIEDQDGRRHRGPLRRDGRAAWRRRRRPCGSASCRRGWSG